VDVNNIKCKNLEQCRPLRMWENVGLKRSTPNILDLKGKPKFVFSSPVLDCLFEKLKGNENYIFVFHVTHSPPIPKLFFKHY
jgi:hypothetical protein